MSDRFRHSQHVFRMAGLFVVGIGAFFVLRAVYVPADFGVYGHYRAGAIDANRAKPLGYGGRAVCADCHPDVVEARTGGRHERIGCEACHGPAAGHASGDDKAPKPVKPDTRLGCMVCHTKNVSKAPGFPQVTAAEHAPEGACTTCHNPHHPKVS